uniref:Uncharacterized protein n=1 Tax=Avena sativa TaxID=4498 RepID=A0ACD5VM38_AVESA
MNNYTTPSRNATPNEYTFNEPPPTPSASGSSRGAGQSSAGVAPRTSNMDDDDDEMPPAPNPGSNTAGLVTMTRPMYSKKNVALTADSVTVVVELQAAVSPAVREGLDLVVVLDVSSKDNVGRMKTAMQFVINKLTPTDRLCIVTFADGATRHNQLRCMTAAAHKDLEAIVGGLKLATRGGGGANIKAGMDAALAVFTSRKHTNGRTTNIFLLSNGVQSSTTGGGGGDARLVDVGNVAVFTFGIGKETDNNAVLSTIARKSAGGTFSTVQDGADLTTPLAELLGGVLTVVAQDVKLTLKPNRKEKHLDTMVVAPGLDYQQTTTDDGKITIQFGALFSGETRKVVINMKLLPTKEEEDEDEDEEEAEEEDAKLADAKLSYMRQGDKDSGKAPRLIQIQRTPHPAAAAPAGGDRHSNTSSVVVVLELARRKHAETIRAVRQLADAGNLDVAKDTVMDALNGLENIMVEEEGQKLVVDNLRDELRQLLALMDNKDLYSRRGHPYALACETSHAHQRFAAKGDNSRSFATYRMDNHRDEATQFVKDLISHQGRRH